MRSNSLLLENEFMGIGLCPRHPNENHYKNPKQLTSESKITQIKDILNYEQPE